MPGWRTWIALLSTSFDELRTVMLPVEIVSSPESGSEMVVCPVRGVGEIVRLAGLYPPWSRILDEPLSVTVPAPPLVPRAPPSDAAQPESIISEASNTTVGPPEKRTDGQPRRPFGHELLDGSSVTTEYSDAESWPLIAVLVVETWRPEPLSPPNSGLPVVVSDTRTAKF